MKASVSRELFHVKQLYLHEVGSVRERSTTYTHGAANLFHVKQPNPSHRPPSPELPPPQRALRTKSAGPRAISEPQRARSYGPLPAPGRAASASAGGPLTTPHGLFDSRGRHNHGSRTPPRVVRSQSERAEAGRQVPCSAPRELPSLGRRFSSRARVSVGELINPESGRWSRSEFGGCPSRRLAEAVDR
jgi:hypothetical protein